MALSDYGIDELRILPLELHALLDKLSPVRRSIELEGKASTAPQSTAEQARPALD